MGSEPTSARAESTGPWNPGAIVGLLVGLGALVYWPGLVSPSIGPQTLWFVAALAGAAVLTAWRLPDNGQSTSRAWTAVFGLTLALVALAAVRAGVPVLALKIAYYRLIFMGFCLIGLRIAGDRETWTVAADWLVGGAILISLIGLGQAAGWLTFIPQAAPPAATLGNKNAAAHLVAAALPLALRRLAGGGKRPGFKPTMAAGCLVLIAFLIAAGSWAGSWAALIGLLVCGALVRSPGIRRLARTGLVVCLAGGAALLIWSQVGPTESTSAALVKKTEARRAVWADGVRLIKARPLLGFGLGQFPTVWPPQGDGPGIDRTGPGLDLTTQFRRVHNDFLEWSLEAGWLGGLLLVVLVGSPLVRLGRRTGDNLGAGLAGSLAAWAVVACFSFPLELPASAAWWGLAVGAGIGLGSVGGDRAAPAPQGKNPVFSRWMLVAAGLLILVSLAPPGRQIKAESLAVSGWADQDESSLIEAADKNLWGLDPPFHLGLFYQQRGRYDRAAEVYAGLLQTYPNQAGVLFNLALCRLNNGQADRAADPARRLLQLVPNDRRVLLLNWRVGLKTGQGEAAVSAARRLVKLWPRDKENILALARAQALAGRDRDALGSLTRLLSGPGRIGTRWLGQAAVLLAVLNRRVAERPDLAEQAAKLGQRLNRLRR